MAFSALVVITTLVAKTEMGWALGERIRCLFRASLLVID